MTGFLNKMYTKKDILESCIEEVRLHGKDGDNTFECVGVILKNGRFTRIKAYYKQSRNTTPALLWYEPCKSVYEGLKAANEGTGLEFCDAAVYNKGTEEEIWAVNYTTGKIPAERLTDVLESFKQLAPETGFLEQTLNGLEKACGGEKAFKAPLHNLGLWVDNKGQVKALKYYLLMKQSVHEFLHMGAAAVDFLEELSGEIDRELIEKRSKILEENSFYPVLFGKNVYINGDTEQKLYFDTESNNIRGKDVAKNAIEALRGLGILEFVGEDTITALKEKHIYLRGFCLNLKEPEEIRLYFDRMLIRGIKKGK